MFQHGSYHNRLKQSQFIHRFTNQPLHSKLYMTDFGKLFITIMSMLVISLDRAFQVLHILIRCTYCRILEYMDHQFIHAL